MDVARDPYLDQASVELAREQNLDLERRVQEVIVNGGSPLLMIGVVEGGSRGAIERAEELRQKALAQSSSHFIKFEERED